MLEKIFPSDPKAFIVWEKDGKYEMLYGKSSSGKVTSVKEGGNKDMESSKFEVSDSILFSVDQERHRIVFDGNPIRLGLSMSDFSKPLESVTGWTKTTAESALRPYKDEGMKLTLNLTEVGYGYDERDEAFKVASSYEFNETTPLEIDKGIEPSRVIKKLIKRVNISPFISFEEFQVTFDNLTWS